MRILVVDDQPDEFFRFKRVLKADTSVTVVFTETPAAAEKAMESGAFDALLLDGFLDLSNDQGPKVLRSWKARGLALPPVYMISSDKEMQAEGVTAGAVGFIDKKLLLEGILDALKQRLKAG